MSTPLTDAITALTTYANGVTGESDTTLSDAVYTLAQGYGQNVFNPMKYIALVANMFNGSTFSENVVLDFTGSARTTGGSTYQMFFNTTGADSVEIIGIIKTASFEMFRAFFAAAFKTIRFTNCSIVATSWRDAFANNALLQNIIGDLDFTGATNVDNAFERCSALVGVSFVASTIPLSISFGSCSLLSNASLVSIANGLNETITGQTLTLHATPYATCATVTGTVANGVFTTDDAGSVTLADFIANTKGWALASA